MQPGFAILRSTQWVFDIKMLQMRNTQQIALTILPFADLSPESNLGLYCRSFRDDLVTELSRFRQLRIIRLPENYGLSKQEEFIGQLDENYIVERYFHSRVTAGIHFRFACEAGQQMGNAIGQWLFDNYLQPIR